jgi:hypothetical protein
MRVHLAQGEQLADLGGGPPRGIDRLDHRSQHGHDRVADAGPDCAKQRVVGLADQQQGERDHDQRRESEALEQRLQRQGQS